MASEIDRLRKVYRAYRTNPAVQAKWSPCHPGNRAIESERFGYIGRMVQSKTFPRLDSSRILDIGCGSGKVLADWVTFGARSINLFGVDLLADRIQTAQVNYPEFHFQCANAEHLDYPNQYFHIILFFTVFSSILDPAMRDRIAKEADRLLVPGGVIVWYDFRYNNPQNPHVRGLKLKDIHRLFPDYALTLETITVAPPLARRLKPFTDCLYPVLAGLPFLKTHFIGMLKKRSDYRYSETEK